MAANVYYSVSPFGTGDIKTGSPTITISSGVATLSVGQTGNIGQGDRITYNTSSVCYISGVTDSTHFSVVTATGGTPSNVSGQTVNSIAHEYASLSAAEAGASDASHVNNTSLVTADVVLNIACYYDHDDQTADGTNIVVDGYTSDSTRYINIYTPTGGTQSINRQRHQGKWSTSYYRIVSTGHVITISDLYVHMRGIQADQSSGSWNESTLYFSVDQARASIDACIFKSEVDNSVMAGGGIIGFGYTSNGSGLTSITNCIIYGKKGTYGAGIFVGDYNFNLNLYNTVICDCTHGVEWWDNYIGTLNIKNCAIFNTADDIVDGGSATVTISHCAIDDADSFTGKVDISPGATESTEWAKAFTDYANGDFSIKDTDSVLYDAGTDLSGTFTTDIKGTTRSSWDIGAFEYIVPLAFPPLFARKQNTLLRR